MNPNTVGIDVLTQKVRTANKLFAKGMLYILLSFC